MYKYAYLYIYIYMAYMQQNFALISLLFFNQLVANT